MTFDTLNTDKTPGTKNAGAQVITQAEYTAAITALIAARGGGAGGAPAAGGAAPAPGGAAPAPGGAAAAGGGQGGGRGAFDPVATYTSWDTNADGEVTQAEFDARPRRGGGGGGAAGAGGGGARGGGAPGGAAPAPAPAPQ